MACSTLAEPVADLIFLAAEENKTAREKGNSRPSEANAPSDD